jgi:hypothetical protein
LHINGCLHLEIQPLGTNPKTGKMNDAFDFDIRLLKGPKIPKLDDEELEQSRRRNPSSIHVDRASPRKLS